MFGEKDWQQLQVVRAMAAADASALIRAVAILPGATVREADGLAMSSRNRFLSKESREKAAALARSLCEAAGCPTVGEAEAAMLRVLDGVGARVDYATVRAAETLDRLERPRTDHLFAGPPGRWWRPVSARATGRSGCSTTPRGRAEGDGNRTSGPKIPLRFRRDAVDWWVYPMGGTAPPPGRRIPTAALSEHG